MQLLLHREQYVLNVFLCARIFVYVLLYVPYCFLQYSYLLILSSYDVHDMFNVFHIVVSDVHIFLLVCVPICYDMFLCIVLYALIYFPIRLLTFPYLVLVCVPIPSMRLSCVLYMFLYVPTRFHTCFRIRSQAVLYFPMCPHACSYSFVYFPTVSACSYLSMRFPTDIRSMFLMVFLVQITQVQDHPSRP